MRGNASRIAVAPLAAKIPKGGQAGISGVDTVFVEAAHIYSKGNGPEYVQIQKAPHHDDARDSRGDGAGVHGSGGV